MILPTPKQREIIVWHCWDLSQSAWHKVRSQRHHRVYHSPYITLPISGTKQYQNSELFYISAFLPIFPISCMWHLQPYGTSSCGHLWGGGNRLVAWDQLDWQRDWLFSEDGDQCVSFLAWLVSYLIRQSKTCDSRAFASVTEQQQVTWQTVACEAKKRLLALIPQKPFLPGGQMTLQRLLWSSLWWWFLSVKW